MSTEQVPEGTVAPTRDDVAQELREFIDMVVSFAQSRDIHIAISASKMAGPDLVGLGDMSGDLKRIAIMHDKLTARLRDIIGAEPPEPPKVVLATEGMMPKMPMPKVMRG